MSAPASDPDWLLFYGPLTAEYTKEGILYCMLNVRTGEMRGFRKKTYQMGTVIYMNGKPWGGQPAPPAPQF